MTGGVHAWLSREQQTRIFRRRRILGESRSLLDVSRDTDSVLLNSQPVFDFAMPLSPQILHMGGFSVKEQPPPLPREWEPHISSPFLLVTFGSIARTSDMSQSSLSSFLTAFSQLPNTRFILKFETVLPATLPLPPNVFLTPWMPQLQLLGESLLPSEVSAHPNCQGIVTHGGWSSILESVAFGRPLIVMPLFADHAKNAKVVEAKGVGLILDKQRLSSDVVLSALRRLREDSR